MSPIFSGTGCRYGVVEVSVCVNYVSESLYGRTSWMLSRMYLDDLECQQRSLGW